MYLTFLRTVSVPLLRKFYLFPVHTWLGVLNNKQYLMSVYLLRRYHVHLAQNSNFMGCIWH